MEFTLLKYFLLTLLFIWEISLICLVIKVLRFYGIRQKEKGGIVVAIICAFMIIVIFVAILAIITIM